MMKETKTMRQKPIGNRVVVLVAGKQSQFHAPGTTVTYVFGRIGNFSDPYSKLNAEDACHITWQDPNGKITSLPENHPYAAADEQIALLKSLGFEEKAGA